MNRDSRPEEPTTTEGPWTSRSETIRIHERDYELEDLTGLPGTDASARATFAVTSDEGETYHVTDPAGPSCTCKAYQYRPDRGHKQGACKHIRALVALGKVRPAYRPAGAPAGEAGTPRRGA
jgi:hypothetical protein